MKNRFSLGRCLILMTTYTLE